MTQTVEELDVVKLASYLAEHVANQIQPLN
jgi:hypothetical protein